MLNTSHGMVPWDDLHHTELSQTDGEVDGRWVFGNANNTPRIARIDLKTFTTKEIIELPNSAGNHSSPFITENTEYVVAGTRFSVPPDNSNGDVPINTYKQNFDMHPEFISKDQCQVEVDYFLHIKDYNIYINTIGDVGDNPNDSPVQKVSQEYINELINVYQPKKHQLELSHFRSLFYC